MGGAGGSPSNVGICTSALASHIPRPKSSGRGGGPAVETSGASDLNAVAAGEVGALVSVRWKPERTPARL